MAGRPKKNEAEKLVSVGLAIPPDIDAEIEKFLESDGRLKGQVLRLIFMRGWQAYKRDGKLMNGVPVVSATTEGSKKGGKSKAANR